MGKVGTAAGGGRVTVTGLEKTDNLHASVTVEIYQGSKLVKRVQGNPNTWHIPGTGGSTSGDYYSFNISSYPGHANLTASDFLVTITSAKATYGGGGGNQPDMAVQLTPMVEYTPGTGRGRVKIRGVDKRLSLTLSINVLVKD